MEKRLQKYKALPDKKVVLLQSGGLDSCVCDALLHWAGFEVTELFVDYGQSALEKEWAMSQEMSDLYGHKLIRVSIDLPWLKTLPIVGGEVRSTGVEEIKRGVVDPESYIPLRNHILLGLAGSLAESLQIKYICTGLNGSQNILGKPRDGFVDTHPRFAEFVAKSLTEGSVMKHHLNGKFTVLTPLMSKSKPEIISLGLEVGANMSLSWSCFNNGDVPCCHCSSCIGRAEGFALVNMQDPLLTDLGVKFPKNNLFQ